MIKSIKVSLLAIVLLRMITTAQAVSFSVKNEDVYVYDGDTIGVPCRKGYPCKKFKFPCRYNKNKTCTAESLVIRGKGFNTAEINGKCDYEIRLAKKTKKAVSVILKNTSYIIVSHDQRNIYDRYNRLLADVKFDSKIDWGRFFIKNNLARRWTGKRRSWCD